MHPENVSPRHSMLARPIPSPAHLTYLRAGLRLSRPKARGASRASVSLASASRRPVLCLRLTRDSGSRCRCEEEPQLSKQSLSSLQRDMFKMTRRSKKEEASWAPRNTGRPAKRASPRSGRLEFNIPWIFIGPRDGGVGLTYKWVKKRRQWV